VHWRRRGLIHGLQRRCAPSARDVTSSQGGIVH